MLGILLVLTGTQLLGIGLIGELMIAGQSKAEDRFIIDGIYGDPEVSLDNMQKTDLTR